MEIVTLAFGLIGVSFGLFCGWRLWRWEKQLAHARIAIAYKRKVKLQAPLVEWLQWGNMLAKDETTNGRTVYMMGGTTVAILKPQPRRSKTKTRAIKAKAAA